MPLQNRVDPWGTIFSCAERGTFMGNRGEALHNDKREIVRSGAIRRWLICLLEFKGRKRPLMAPGQYTELFFLDEAVALSAGHRPCKECRRERFIAYQEAFMISHGGAKPPKVDEIDGALHTARIDKAKKKITYQAPLNSLPNGCFIQLESDSYLVYGDSLFLWSPGGYTNKHQRPTDLTVTILTPEPSVRCLREGYKPQVHNSLAAL